MGWMVEPRGREHLELSRTGNEPSFFAREACGACAFRVGGGLDGAAVLGAEELDEGGGTADPGALFGNLRMVLCAADLDAPEPIVAWFLSLSVLFFSVFEREKGGTEGLYLSGRSLYHPLNKLRRSFGFFFLALGLAQHESVP